MRDKKGGDLDGREGKEELGGVDGEETIINVNYVGKNLFSIKGGKLHKSLCTVKETAKYRASLHRRETLLTTYLIGVLFRHIKS